MGDDGAPPGRRSSRCDRVSLLAVVGALVVALLPGGTGGSRPASAQDAAAVDALATVELPPSLGQSEMQVYVEATDHTLAGVLLDYWRATGGAAVYGNPISEPFAAENGYYSQAFERGIFQYRPDVVWTVEPIVRLMPIGQAALDDRVGTFRADGRRGNGGGDRRGAAWRPLNPDGATVAGVVADGGLFVEATGHTISDAFLAWYRRHEGDFYLGNPLSEPLRERGRMVQWFEGGLLMGDADGVRLAPIVRELALRLGIDTTPVERGDLPAYDEALFWTADNPNPMGDLSTAGAKRIEVSLSQQTLWAYQGDTLVLTSFVSSGLPPNETSTGRFRVRYKVPVEDMRGATDAEGNVVWVVGDGGKPPPGSIPYGVPDVPDVMYFSLDAEALHGAYWHNAFGTPTSHGCINLPLDVAAFLYGWAPLGTPVLVYE